MIAFDSQGSRMKIKNVSFLFVCTGNICRSPMGEVAFRAEAEKRGLSLLIDSAGIGAWHRGEPPDRRAQIVALRHGHDISAYRARQIEPADFRRFTHFIAMDTGHVEALRRLAPLYACSQIRLLMDSVPEARGADVDDPYYGDEGDFEVTWDRITKACAHLAAEILDPT